MIQQPEFIFDGTPVDEPLQMDDKFAQILANEIWFVNYIQLTQ